jgi:hypothetical protein
MNRHVACPSYRGMRVAPLLLSVVAVHCAREPARVETRDASGGRASTNQVMDSAAPSAPTTGTIIGRARMSADKTITLDLFVPASSQVRYEPSHPQYRSVLEHIGGLTPGEEKPVPAWPDTFDATRVEAAGHAHAASIGWARSDYELKIVGTDAKTGGVVVTLAHVDDKRARAPGGGKSVSLRIDPKTYEVVQVLHFQ